MGGAVGFFGFGGEGVTASARGLRHFEPAFKRIATRVSVLEFEYLFGTFFLNTFFLNTRDDFF